MLSKNSASDNLAWVKMLCAMVYSYFQGVNNI